MLKQKASFVLALGYLFAFVLCGEISLYLASTFFDPIQPINVFHFCISLFTTETIGYYSIVLFVNAYIAYTLFVVCRRVIRQTVHSYKFKKSLTLIKNIEVTNKINEQFNRTEKDIIVINSLETVAFTFGFRKPLIVFSTGLTDMLDEKELEAVVFHETAHQKNKDAIKIFTLQIISEVMWYIPLTQWSYNNYKIMSELMADEYAVSRMGSELGLGSALLKLIKTRLKADTAPAVVPFTDGIVDFRLRQLMEPKYSIPVRLEKRSVIISVNVLLLIMILLILA
jgi:Zn-dependent protease with chaperone function